MANQRQYRLADLMNEQQAEGQMPLSALVGQIPGTFGQGQGAFQRAGGSRVDLTPQGWQDSASGQMIAPRSSGNDQLLDYANPIDFMGTKGYRLKGDSNRVLLNDGRMVTLNAGDVGAQQAARQRAEAQALDMDLKRANLEQTLAKTAQISQEKERRPSAEWKYDSGSDTWVAPPDAENPAGRMTQPQSKLNASKALDYVAGELEKTIEKTPQGGFMGVKGLIGKVTDSQQAKRFDNLKEQLSTELRTLFRIPGEGALSDKEQAQYGVQLPDVTKDADTNKAIIQDIRKRTSLRLGMSPQQSTPSSQPPLADLVRQAEQAIAAGADRTAVMQRLMQMQGGR